jgi:hypothetical protein
MKSSKIFLLLAVFILAQTLPAQARSGGHGGGRGSGRGYTSGSHSRGSSYSGGYHGGGYYGGGVRFYPRAYWGPGPYYSYWGWPYYYPSAYAYAPPLAYNYPPVPHSPPPNYYMTPGEVPQTSLQEDPVFIYPRQGQSQAQQAKDRNECQQWATSQTGVDSTKPPPAGMSEDQLVQKSRDYNRALDACLDARGYTLR